MARTSILPNSSPSILKPMAQGLQVAWDEASDQHILSRNGDRIAGHHNGFSCSNLAEWMLAGNTARALEQFDYIKACGGTHYITREQMEALAFDKPQADNRFPPTPGIKAALHRMRA